MSFEKMRVATRLNILVFLAVLGMTILNISGLIQLKHAMLDDRKAKLQNLVELALGVTDHYQKLAVAGKLSNEEAQVAAKDALRKLRYSTNEYFFALNSEGVFVFHGVKAELEGKKQLDQKDARGNYYVRDLVKAAHDGGDFVNYWFTKPGGTVELPKLSYSARFAPWDWAIGTGIYIDDIDAEFRRSATIAGGITIALLALLVVLGWKISTSIRRQLGGEPADAAAIMQEVAAGNLTVKVDSAHPRSMLAALDGMVNALKDLVSGINTGADQVVKNAEHISTASREVSTAAALQSDATASIAAAIEELTVSSNHISESARETRTESDTARSASIAGYERVEQATDAIRRISTTVSDASARIHVLEQKATEVTTIANVIKEIAGQTNLLALNAAIEAARAGEQGRGFAVVADEVRKLAERTASATSEIEEMIHGIQAETGGAVAAMNAALPEVEQGVALGNAASESLRMIETGSQRNLTRIGEIADATLEQSSASTSIAQRVEQIAQMVDETSATIHNTADTAGQLEQIAQDLKARIQRFRI